MIDPVRFTLRIFMVVVVSASTIALQLPIQAASLKVMSFNIRGDFDLEQATNSSEAWNALSQEHRRDLVVRTIAEFSPDLFGVQEAFQHQLVDLKHGLSGYAFSGLGRDDGKEAGEHSAIFYRVARFELVKEGSFWLSNAPDEPGSRFPGAGYVRIASWVILADNQAGGKKYFVLNTHFDNESAAAREYGAKLIRQELNTLAEGLPTLVMGDLNDVEDSVPLKTLHGSANDDRPLYDSFREILPQRGKDEATYQGFTGATAGSRIDFILHSPDFKVSEASIVHTNFSGRYPSDHFPVTAEFEVVQ
jgi:endonuclease/exonuclease/phosphatase family metal-dependent hydrolase